ARRRASGVVTARAGRTTATPPHVDDGASTTVRSHRRIRPVARSGGGRRLALPRLHRWSPHRIPRPCDGLPSYSRFESHVPDRRPPPGNPAVAARSGRRAADAALSSPLVSVVVPFFDAHRFLAEALTSVLAQGYTSLEILLVDDGSTDGGADSIAHLLVTDARIRLLRQWPNQGPAVARNRALRQARGTFVAFLDADDLMVRDRIAFQVDYLETHSGVDVVLGEADYFTEAGIDLPHWHRNRPAP